MEVFLGTKQRDGSVVSIQGPDRRKHMAIFGKSGVGKTTLMRNMIVADLHAGNGITVIDPHGSLIEDILGCIPLGRTNDVIYLDPANPSRVIGLNVLQSVGKNQRSLVVSSLISILRNLYPNNWGPRTEYILEHAVYALLEQPQPVTLAALPKLLVDHNYRKLVVAHVSDPAVQAFFRFFELQNDRLREESIAPLIRFPIPPEHPRDRASAAAVFGNCATIVAFRVSGRRCEGACPRICRQRRQQGFQVHHQSPTQGRKSARPPPALISVGQWTPGKGNPGTANAFPARDEQETRGRPTRFRRGTNTRASSGSSGVSAG